MGALMRAYDWSVTPLGLPSSWPQGLRTIVRLLLSTRHPMFIWWGPDLIQFYNDAYSRSIGPERHPSALGQPGRLCWAEIWDIIGPQIELVMSGRGSTWNENRLVPITRDGSREDVYWTYSYSPIDDPDTPNGVGGVLVLCAETTERVTAEKQKDAELAARTAERDRLWANAQDMLVVIDMQGVFQTANPAMTRILGWTHEEIVGRTVFELIHPDDQEATLGALKHASGSELPSFVNRYRHKDGGYRWFAWVAAPEGDLIYATARHITAEKNAAEELALAQEALRQSQKLEAMGQLTGGVAHDFNNLLTPIVGSLDMLVRKGLGNERQQRLIEGALQSAERARVLVQRLLAFSRRQPLQASPIDMAGLIDGMAGLIASTTGPQIKVVVDVQPDLPAALADPHQLEMAILNLSVNARDAMEQGGTLRISACAETVEGGHRSKLVPGHYVCLSVADTGTGMDAATLARAIEPFFSTKGIGKGTGLGLSMVHGLASQSGGALTVSSKEELGTNVELWLPVSAVPVETAGAVAIALSTDKVSGTALLVDDEDLVRASTASMLIEIGYSVVEAGSAEEASKLLDGGLQADVLVTDHLMPGRSGIELAREVQARFPATRILIVSGFAEAEGVAPDLTRLTKPFRQAELAALLMNVDGD